MSLMTTHDIGRPTTKDVSGSSDDRCATTITLNPCRLMSTGATTCAVISHNGIPWPTSRTQRRARGAGTTPDGSSAHPRSVPATRPRCDSTTQPQHPRMRLLSCRVSRVGVARSRRSHRIRCTASCLVRDQVVLVYTRSKSVWYSPPSPASHRAVMVRPSGPKRPMKRCANGSPPRHSFHSSSPIDI
jgi:hypothetical protein